MPSVSSLQCPFFLWNWCTYTHMILILSLELVHIDPHDSDPLTFSISYNSRVQALAKALGEVVPMITTSDEEQLQNDEDATGTHTLT